MRNACYEALRCRSHWVSYLLCFRERHQVRQYFSDSSFYAKDVSSRDFCDGGFICDDFSPSAATVKVSKQLLLLLE